MLGRDVLYAWEEGGGYGRQRQGRIKGGTGSRMRLERSRKRAKDGRKKTKLTGAEGESMEMKEQRNRPVMDGS